MLTEHVYLKLRELTVPRWYDFGRTCHRRCRRPWCLYRDRSCLCQPHLFLLATSHFVLATVFLSLVAIARHDEQVQDCEAKPDCVASSARPMRAGCNDRVGRKRFAHCSIPPVRRTWHPFSVCMLLEGQGDSRPGPFRRVLPLAVKFLRLLQPRPLYRRNPLEASGEGK